MPFDQGHRTTKPIRTSWTHVFVVPDAHHTASSTPGSSVRVLRKRLVGPSGRPVHHLVHTSLSLDFGPWRNTPVPVVPVGAVPVASKTYSFCTVAIRVASLTRGLKRCLVWCVSLFTCLKKRQSRHEDWGVGSRYQCKDDIFPGSEPFPS